MDFHNVLHIVDGVEIFPDGFLLGGTVINYNQPPPSSTATTNNMRIGSNPTQQGIRNSNNGP